MSAEVAQQAIEKTAETATTSNNFFAKLFEKMAGVKNGVMSKLDLSRFAPKNPETIDKAGKIIEKKVQN